MGDAAVGRRGFHGRVRVVALLPVVLLAAVAGFTLAPKAATATATALAWSDVGGALHLSTDGGATDKVLYDGSNGSVQAFDLAPDGKSVLALEQDSSQLALVPIGGGAPAPIAGTDGALDGAFSPDGSTIVFSSANGISTVPTAGGSAKLVVADTEGNTNALPTYSPNGKQLAYVDSTFDNDGNETDTIELVAAAGGTPSAVATGAAEDPYSGGRLQFSPDGKRIVYAGTLDAPGIYVVAAAAGSTPTQLTSDEDYWPSFSADGSKIWFSRDAYSTNADDQQPTPKKPVDEDADELWSMGADGSSPGVVAEGEYGNVVAGSLASGSGGGTTTSGSTTSHGTTTGTTTTTPTTTTKAPKLVVKVTSKGKRYTVRWTGGRVLKHWRVTLRIGKRPYVATVPARTRSHVFVVKVRGVAHATVVALAK
jgi:Tol biopolymer transport system component